MEGRIAEGPGENIIIVNQNALKTNDESESVLPGITRTTALKIAEDLGYQVEIGPITLDEFFHSDELFFTGTAAEITPICQVTDGRDANKAPDSWQTYQIGKGKPGPITLQISEKYAAIVRGKEEKYVRWLSHVYDSQEEMEANLEDM
jgi:branched-chain amino acid aminotransferase